MQEAQVSPLMSCTKPNEYGTGQTNISLDLLKCVEKQMLDQTSDWRTPYVASALNHGWWLLSATVLSHFTLMCCPASAPSCHASIRGLWVRTALMDTCCHPINLCTVRKITFTINNRALPSAEDKHRRLCEDKVKDRAALVLLVPKVTKRFCLESPRGFKSTLSRLIHQYALLMCSGQFNPSGECEYEGLGVIRALYFEPLGGTLHKHAKTWSLFRDMHWQHVHASFG